MGTTKHREWRRIVMFEEALRDWQGGCLTQDQAAALLGVSARTFRRWFVGASRKRKQPRPANVHNKRLER